MNRLEYQYTEGNPEALIPVRLHSENEIIELGTIMKDNFNNKYYYVSKRYRLRGASYSSISKVQKHLEEKVQGIL